MNQAKVNGPGFHPNIGGRYVAMTMTLTKIAFHPLGWIFQLISIVFMTL